MYQPDRNLRSASNIKLKHKFTRLSKIQKSPYYRGLELWDKLPADIQNVDSAQMFKNKMKNYIVELLIG